jgi:putative transposase
MTRFIDNHKERFGVEPACRVLQTAPSTYYAARRRPLSVRQVRDEALPEAWREQKVKIRHVHAEHFGVYGVRKLWRQLRREGIPVVRCTVERLMRELGLSGVVRGKTKRTTVSDDTVERPADLVERNFRAPAPNRLWVADLAYPDPDRDTWSGFAYVAFVIDVFSRHIVGWHASSSLHSDLALAALDQALWARDPLDGLVHLLTPVLWHSDRGVQYLSARYTERLAEAGAVASVGSRGDSYDNAMAESVIGLYKAELVHRRGPWRGLSDLELATLEWVDWFNNRRLFSATGYVPPVEYEADCYSSHVSALAGTQQAESPRNPGRFSATGNHGIADTAHSLRRTPAFTGYPRLPGNKDLAALPSLSLVTQGPCLTRSPLRGTRPHVLFA